MSPFKWLVVSCLIPVLTNCDKISLRSKGQSDKASAGLSADIKQFIAQETKAQLNCPSRQVIVAELEKLRNEVAEFKKYKETVYGVIAAQAKMRQERTKRISDNGEKLNAVRMAEARRLVGEVQKLCADTEKPKR